ncbi:hypothetical protein NP777_06415 [Streptomyces sp. RCU064]|uniref:Uncharacterized protein n=1 Tax=Streptomyces rugosispiralis TaxID=2967341 RepID=A0ABT1URY3_9ACTN|nr:hypothetical protein [Streptomyces rugosispiralis]MCQ8187886.1 hypothetical protein [Streptomyces rugosispiralis]
MEPTVASFSSSPGNANGRTDRYGGSVAGRVRFPLDLVEPSPCASDPSGSHRGSPLAAPRSASPSGIKIMLKRRGLSAG